MILRSRIGLLVLVVGAMLVGGCHGQRVAPGPSRDCSLGTSAERIDVPSPGPGEEHWLFDLADSARWWAPGVPDAALEAYRREVIARLGAPADASALLARQRAVLERSGRATRDVANIALILGARAGTIRPMRCIDLALWHEQARRYPMLAHPTEFGAFVLRGQGRLRIYFSTAARIGQRLRGVVTDRVRADVTRGFVLVTHVHNHPFMFDRAVGDRLYTTAETVRDIGGALAPSANDVQFYRGLRADGGLRSATIVNGFDFARIDADAFDTLAAAGD